MPPPVSETLVLDALRAVKDPDLHPDIVKLGFVKGLTIDGGRVAFTIELTTPACPVKDQLRAQAEAVVAALPGVERVDVEMTASVRSASTPDAQRAPVPGVKNVIAVGAGKGGVCKTTVAVNLAIALARCGGRCRKPYYASGRAWTPVAGCAPVAAARTTGIGPRCRRSALRALQSTCD